jgi:hypothetical protein
MYLHDVDLGVVLDEAAMARIFAENKDSDVLRAVLQLLRNRAAEDRAAATSSSRNSHYVEKDTLTGELRLVPMNDPKFHAGAAQGTEDAFWSIWEVLQPEKAEG